MINETSLFKKIRILHVNSEEPEAEAISIAAGVIRDGGLVAFPTETVYGLGANLLDRNAVERLYRIKKRPSDKPLTVHIADVGVIYEMAGEIPDYARRLIKRFWPGPLTLILKTKDGRKTGFRMPSNRVALSLIKASGVPIVAPSANISGNRPPKDAREVMEDLYDAIDMILDGGPTEVGIESTVVDASVYPVNVLREAAISKEDLEGVWRDG
jgi:L-threonylcarbamoyladenylate synthase